MKDSYDNSLYLAKSAYCNIVRSVLEEPSKEMMGYLIGKPRGNKMIALNAYPVLTSIRKPSEVSFGNDSAAHRLVKLEEIWNLKMDRNSSSYIGGYHSHVLNSSIPELSNPDMESIEEEIEELEKEEWTEIIAKVDSIKYKRNKVMGQKITERKKKLEIMIYDESKHAYKILLCAFKVDYELNKSELKLRLDNKKF